MKYLIFFLVTVFLFSCESSDTVWTQLFQDNFDNSSFRTGVNDYVDAGTFSIISPSAICAGTNCGAEYEAAADQSSGSKLKMTLWFSLSGTLAAGDYISLFTPNDNGGECEHAIAVMNVNGTNKLVISENSDTANFVASADISGDVTTHDLEFYGENGTITAILKYGETEVARVSGTVSDTGCTYGEVGFAASDGDNSGLSIYMRHFTVYTGE